jgi:hypothetical protein
MKFLMMNTTFLNDTMRTTGTQLSGATNKNLSVNTS